MKPIEEVKKNRSEIVPKKKVFVKYISKSSDEFGLKHNAGRKEFPVTQNYSSR